VFVWITNNFVVDYDLGRALAKRHYLHIFNVMGKKLKKTSAAKLVDNKLKIGYSVGSEDPWGEFPSPLYKQLMEKLGRVDENMRLEDFKPVEWSSFNLIWRDVDWSDPVKSDGGKITSYVDLLGWDTSVYDIASYVRPLDPRMFDLDVAEGKDLEVESFRLDIVPDEKMEGRIILLHEVGRLQRCIEDIYYDHGKLYRISAREFEEVSAELLRGQGFDVELTKQTRDGGFDLLAVHKVGDIPMRFLVECKRYAPGRAVGVRFVRELASVIQANNANKGLLLTTSYFSADALAFRDRHMPYQLDLRDNGDLLAWIRAYIHP